MSRLHAKGLVGAGVSPSTGRVAFDGECPIRITFVGQGLIHLRLISVRLKATSTLTDAIVWYHLSHLMYTACFTSRVS